MRPDTTITESERAFGCNIDRLYPDYSLIPEEFKRFHSQNKWNKLFSDWFFCGLNNLQLTPKAGIDKAQALRHIRTIMGSFEPGHNEKEAMCAFLFSEWFEDATWEPRKREK
jgi:hypothetical protein